MVEVHTEMMQVMTQYIVNFDSKELPPGMQQVLYNHSQMVQMIPHMLAVADNKLSQNNLGSKEPRGEAEITLLACKIFGEIGHTSKGCCEQCPYCDRSHPVGECPMAHVTCFLCDGINHVPRECKFYFTVQQMNQQAKDRLSQLLAKTPEDRRPKAEVEAKDKEIAPETTTKGYLTGRKQEHLPGNYSKKHEKFPTTIVEYEEKKVRDLLALERPKKKKDYSKVLCLNCNKLRHYARKCPERNRQRGTNLVTCGKCSKNGHYARRCTEEGTSRLQ
jgi:hypothetical protein